jgi:uncharacterized protein (DUF169 family)
MTRWADLEHDLAHRLGTSRRPVAVAFRDAPPPGVAPLRGPQPSGCSFWRLAADGGVFYTVPADHHNCPIGSYTHGIDLPPERAPELNQTLGLMADLGYIRMEEVPAIPRLSRAPGVVVYAPLGSTPVDPDVVLVAGRPGRVMLLQEAAGRAGVAVQPSLLGRPTCMALPAALAGGTVASTACIGNRVYTDLGDDELYVVVRGGDLGRLVAALPTILNANDTLAAYHRDRRQALASQ